jgi:hypothetical protein
MYSNAIIGLSESSQKVPVLLAGQASLLFVPEKYIDQQHDSNDDLDDPDQDCAEPRVMLSHAPFFLGLK